MSNITDLQRFHACMEYQPVDHTPFWDWGAWPETIERWKREGYQPESGDPATLADSRHFFSQWFFPFPPFEHRVVSEDERTIVYVNHEGILMKERKDNPMSSMPQFLKFPVDDRHEFRKFWKERMQPNLNQRIGSNWQEQLLTWRMESIPMGVISDRWGGFFGPLRNLVGVQKLCTLFYDDPPFLEEMMEANADFIIAMMSQILNIIKIDVFIFWEDMGYKAGPLVSPKMVRQYMLPNYRRVVDFLRGYGVKYIGLDSDGQIEPLIPVWLDAGLNCLYPFEVQAGMDVLAIRRKYGKELRIWGGVDKRVLAVGPAAIKTELARLRPLIQEGGYIPHTDHSCPPDISFENYSYYMGRLKEICSSR